MGESVSLKRLLLCIGVFYFWITNIALAQCNGTITSTANPPPTGGGYSPGTVVTFCITMTGYSQAGTNWFEGFDINLGAGWVGPPTPVTAPVNLNGGGGQWIWVNSFVAPNGQTYGPGYFFDLNNNGSTQDDFGDAGTGTWSMCFSATVGNTPGASLSVNVAPLSDGLAGSWNSNACDGVSYSPLVPNNTIIIGCGNLVPSITGQQNVLCNGQSNGSFTVSTAGGANPFTFSFNNGPYNSTSSYSNLAAGVYTVTIMDANGCTVPYGTTITQPATPLSVTLIFKNNVGCTGGSTGSYKIIGSGGTSPFTYSTDGITYVPANSSAAFLTNGLPIGTYNVYVKDANGCVSTLAITITEPLPLTGTITAQTNLPCSGSGTGSVTVAGADGTPTYTYSIGGPYQLSGTFSGLAVGNYTVTIKDANNCTTTVPVVITQPIPLTGSITSQTNVDCFGNATGSLTAGGSNGTSPYTYSLDGITFGGATFNNLAAGNYTVTVKDANGCTGQFNATITEPSAALTLTLTSQTDNDCFGASTGIAVISGNNGTPSYTYSDGTIINVTGVFNGLPAGAHNFTVTDNNGCSANLGVNITQPATGVGAIIASQNNVLCSGTSTGSFTIVGNNGNGPYNYTLNSTTNTTGIFSNLPVGSYNVTVSDASGCTFIQNVNLISPNALGTSINSQTAVSCFGGNNATVDIDAVNGTLPYTFTLGSSSNATGIFNNLAAGIYSITVSDQNGCTLSQPVTITQPSAALSSAISNQTNVSCFGGNNGAVVIAASNGTAPYSYQYNLVNNTTGIFSNFSSGSYTIIVTDQNACTYQQNINITQPLALSATTTSNIPVDCFGNFTGTIDITGNNGTAPYSYTLGIANNTTGLFNGLAAGAYNIIVTDANSCTFNHPVNITQPVAALSAVIQAQTNVSCFAGNNGLVIINASNGTSPYLYGLTGTTLLANDTISNLTATNYNITVQDANGCTASLVANITQPASGLSGIINNVTDVLCFGNATGAIDVSANNGTAPYSFSIAGTTNSTGVFNGLAAGNYTINITDANNCSSNMTADVNQPDSALTVDITSFTNATCNGFSDGTATVIAQGGTSIVGYSYQWNSIPSQNTSTAVNLPMGNYSVTVTDDNGCTATDNTSISQPNFILNATGNFTICDGKDSLLSATSLDGASPVTYTWTNLNTGSNSTGNTFAAQPNITTNYTVVATDNNGCVTPPHNILITVDPLPIASFITDFKEGCEPFCANFSAASTVPNTTWEWDFGDGQVANGQMIANCYKQAGTYTPSLTAISDKGCQTTIQKTDEIIVHNSPKAIFKAEPEQTTMANPLIYFTNEAAGADSYKWDFGDESSIDTSAKPEHLYTTPGNYCIMLYATNTMGCSDSMEVCIDIKPDFHFYMATSFTPNGDGLNDVFKPYGEALNAYHLTVYNRWGLKVFHSDDITIGWDGGGFPQDAYHYVIELINNNGESKIYTGSITLLR